MRVLRLDGAGVPAYTDGIRRVYADVFSAPPWNEDPSEAARYAERLAADAGRPGFTAAVGLGTGAVGDHAGSGSGDDDAGSGGGSGAGSGSGGHDAGAGAAAELPGTVAGFATAWITPDVFPAGRSYGHVAQALGPERVGAWLCGALEVDELAVAPAARGTGLGAALLAAVAETAPGGRCWLLTSVRAEAALRFYRRAGWHRVPAAVPGRAGLVVLLGPGHPGAAGLTGR
ncbi:GNAT family N-acetyltransferase [Streptomyces sp. NPDC002913]